MDDIWWKGTRITRLTRDELIEALGDCIRLLSTGTYTFDDREPQPNYDTLEEQAMDIGIDGSLVRHGRIAMSEPPQRK